LVAQNSDHITHLIGPFHGDVRQKIANELRGDLFGTNQQRPNIGKTSSARPCRAVATIFIVTKTFCKKAKGIISVAAESRSEVRYHDGNTALPRSILVLTGGKQATKN